MKYFQYELLSSEEKQIYSTIEESLKRIDFQIDFGNVPQNYVEHAYTAVCSDHPEYFWITNGYSLKTKRTGYESEITLIPGVRENDPKIIKEKLSILYSVTDELISSMPEHNSKYDQILCIHDYIVELCDYDSTTNNSYDVYGCLINRKAACAGYSAAFQFLLQQIGVPCGRVSGLSSTDSAGSVNHEWNYVYLNNDYFYVDVTWDDPLVISNIDNGGISHDYFGIAENELFLTHTVSRDGSQFVPVCSGNKYDYYRVYGLYFNNYSFDDVKECAENQLKYCKQFSVKFGDSIEANKAVHDLIENKKVFTINGVNGKIRYNLSCSGLILTAYI